MHLKSFHTEHTLNGIWSTLLYLQTKTELLTRNFKQQEFKSLPQQVRAYILLNAYRSSPDYCGGITGFKSQSSNNFVKNKTENTPL